MYGQERRMDIVTQFIFPNFSDAVLMVNVLLVTDVVTVLVDILYQWALS